MDEIVISPSTGSTLWQAQGSPTGTPTGSGSGKVNELLPVRVKFDGRLVGRWVNHGEVKLLIQFREYKGRGPIIVSAIDSNMVEIL